ncbi:hypothetical protein M231_03214 [Tremella mesenterica]|uniref:Ricin B lectin domain-containing protein n=1 Tax=Tremella mesenterica TaxID=5217 RepID=A0A4Q1BNT9_TREME|nr:hypothetical protein M231_03214 [Tremella mesenterica]
MFSIIVFIFFFLILPLNKVKANDGGIYISLLDTESLCLSLVTNDVERTQAVWRGAVGLTNCTNATTWSSTLHIGSLGPLRMWNENFAALPVDAVGFNDVSPTGLNATSYNNTGTYADYTWLWEYTTESTIQYRNNSNLCVQGDTKTMQVTPAKCSGQRDQQWTYRQSADLVSASTVNVSDVYADPEGLVRVHPLGRNDLCVSSLAYPSANDNYNSTLFKDLQAVTARCVNNTSPVSDFQLFQGPINTSYVGPLTFANTSAGFNYTSSSYCLDAGQNPNDGTAIMVQYCNSTNTGQQWVVDIHNHTISLNDTNLCMDATRGSSDLPGAQGLFQPEYLLQVWNCTKADSRQNFTLYTGPDVPASS